MKILAFTKYTRLGPSSRYRYYNYIDCFKENGIDMKVTPFFSDNYLNKIGIINKISSILTAYVKRFWILFPLLSFKNKKYKLVIIEYELMPYFPALFEFLLKLRKVKYIVDYDDAIFHKYDSHKNRFIRWLFRNKISKVMRFAEVVIVGNDYLKKYVLKYNINTMYLPTVVLLEKYQKTISKSEYKNTHDIFTIGWIGSKTTSHYILDILPAIKEFASKYKVRFHLIGFDENSISNVNLEKSKIKILQWSETTEVEELCKFDIGIMPLTDDAWSKGKCGFKLIQYMSCKKPVIASPVGINTIIVEQGVNGLLASSNAQWLSAFEKIYKDSELRKIMAENNWKKILKEYNHQTCCIKYIKLINGLVKGSIND